MNPFAISGLLIGITTLLLGIFVLFKSRGNKANTVWAFFCLAVAVWGFGGLKIGFIKDQTQALWWWRVTYIGIIFIPVFFYHFTHSFLELKGKKVLHLIYIYGLFFLVIQWTPWAHLYYGIDNISLLFNSLYWIYPPTPLFVLFILVWFLIIGYSLSRLFHVFKQVSGIKKSQIKYIILAIGIAFLGGMCFLPCFGVKLYPFFNFAIPFYPIIITYAIVAHRLMDIKFVLRRSFVYSASLVTIMLPAIGVAYLTTRYFNEHMSLVGFCMLLIGVLVFSPVKHFFYRIANKYFFSSLYDAQEVIATLSDKLRSSIEVHQISQMISETFISAFRVKAAGILLYDQETQEFEVVYNHNFQIGDQKRFKNDLFLYDLFARQSKSILVEELKGKLYKKSKPTIDLLKSLGVSILSPLNIQDRNVGLIVLGPKESGDMYNKEDLRVLEVIGAQAAVALQNALLYEESLAFGRKLKVEVEKATHELRQANTRLKELDKAKTEFVSVASHQLRTPLSSLKGYLSMLIEGDFGSMQPQQQKVIKQLFHSNERLVRLVDVLLNISRIEQGRLKLEKKKVHLDDLLQNAVDQLKPVAGAKGLELKYIKPSQPTPAVNVDTDRMMDVIWNLIDNAIKYTTEGSVGVSLEMDQKVVRVKVQDTGIGITKSQLKKLFTKFVRGSGASKLYTSGSGLGLFIAKKIIELHQGRIWGQSPGEGMGTTFVFELPIQQDQRVPQVQQDQ